jgi:hypothetical protein
MNSRDEARSVPRWAGDVPPTLEPTPDERRVLAELLAAIRRIRHGSVEVHIQDGRVVQIDTVEKRRL